MAPTDVFRTPDERFADLDGYRFEPRYLGLKGDLAGLRMHFVREGERAPILLLHGEPTWAYLYRKMIPVLARTSTVIAPDYVGFGRSDKVTERDWYTYDRHVDSVVQLIEELDLRDLTICVQDWGGPIGLRAAVENADRVARLVIMNTGIFRPGPNWPSPGFRAWREFAERNPDLPVGFVIQSATSNELPPQVVAAYEAPFPNEASKAGASAFPLLVPLTADDPGAAEMAAVAEALGRWDKPALVAFSDSDPIFPLRAGERMAERIPGARFEPVVGASHFLQEDAGESLADLVADFVAGTVV